MKNADTIFAAASGSGKSAIRVFRISGRKTSALAEALQLGSLSPRVACFRRLHDPASGDLIDSGLAIWFPAPASFTGEDCLELHVHGGRAVEKALGDALARFRECRLAEPGEFAWRAFSNGKLDLTAVEGLADLLDAETEVQRKLALRSASGETALSVQSWRAALLDCLSLVEAEIDFEDEPDAPTGVSGVVARKVDGLLLELRAAASSYARSEIAKTGFCVVIMGPPNAGKSSLLNVLSRREVAIVASTPGTTRDLLEVQLDLDGCPVVLVDTAGVRSSFDEVERIGIARARERASRAQLVVWLSPPSDLVLPDPEMVDADVLVVHSKADLRTGPMEGILLSTVTGAGVSELLSMISERARAFFQDDDAAHTPRLASLRQLRAVSAAIAALEEIAGEAQPLEIVAEGLRETASRLETLTGRIDSEEVLGDIFSRFCIGK